MRRRHLNAGRWQLERERYQLPEHCQPPSSTSEVAAGVVAAGLLKKVGLDAQLWQQTLLDEWPRLVGDAVARRARPGQMQRGVLTIFVSNAAWLHELARYSKNELLVKLRARFGAEHIKDVRFQPDPDLHPPIFRSRFQRQAPPEGKA